MPGGHTDDLGTRPSASHEASPSHTGGPVISTMWPRAAGCPWTRGPQQHRAEFKDTHSDAAHEELDNGDYLIVEAKASSADLGWRQGVGDTAGRKARWVLWVLRW
ncbi:hypothetical protein GCM10010361_46890 [Streptomyces olivaceiscleroticus]|uniref:Uncharacterized protein n=1 Tax=Streptomyces olivaceiscleroticus TaxID=68245 RepID=A0ABP3KDE9_9ACTN